MQTTRKPVSETGKEVAAAAETAAGPYGGRSVLALIAVVVGSALVAAGVAVPICAYLWGTSAARRRGGAVPEEVPDHLFGHAALGESSPPEATVSVHRQALPSDLAWLRLAVDGRGQLLSRAVNGYPVTVGFAPDCDLVLPASPDARRERVRVWQRDGRFMLRNLVRAGDVRVEDKPVSWVVLKDGDAIDIGGHRVLFESPSRATIPQMTSTSSLAGLGPICPANSVG